MNFNVVNIRQIQYRVLVLLVFLQCDSKAAFGQPGEFTLDSIPMKDGAIVFEKGFKYDLSKEEFNARINQFLSKLLDPVTGEITENSPDVTSCRVVDYIGVGDNMFHSYGVYMIYRLHFDNQDGLCRLTIDEIEYLEKDYINAYLDPLDKRKLPIDTAYDVMVKHKMKQLFVRNASARISKNSIDRFNGIIAALNELFGMTLEEP